MEKAKRMPRGKPFQAGNPGRPKGAKNKLTADLKEALLAPFDPVAFAKWARKKEDSYFTLIVTKLLPKDLNIRNINSLDDLTEEEMERLLGDLERRLGLTKQDGM